LDPVPSLLFAPLDELAKADTKLSIIDNPSLHAPTKQAIIGRMLDGIKSAEAVIATKTAARGALRFRPFRCRNSSKLRGNEVTMNRRNRSSSCSDGRLVTDVLGVNAAAIGRRGHRVKRRCECCRGPR
jgi:hypothetical protein